ncbi:hypothetical protein [Hutsoniella sourekii]|uniref:hypothetical protein n=1 Tax=Hutsoniella sourekii TaxID=87650 RepID=UPI000482AA6D|nr:hypothetical protein [Hutsoniella sourekii]
MNKIFTTTLLISLISNFASPVFAEDSSEHSSEMSQEETSLSSQSFNSDLSEDESSAGEVRVIDQFGSNLDEGNIYKTDDNYYPYITLGNIRYNNEWLLIDVRIDLGYNNYNETLDDALQNKNILNIYQADTAGNNEEPVQLKPEYNNIPRELEGQLEIPTVKTIIENDADTDKEITHYDYSIPYKFERPLDTAAKLIIEIGEEQIEVELETDNPVL